MKYASENGYIWTDLAYSMNSVAHFPYFGPTAMRPSFNSNRLNAFPVHTSFPPPFYTYVRSGSVNVRYGTLRYGGVYGQIWSSMAYVDETSGYDIYFMDAEVDYLDYSNRYGAFAGRCQLL